MGKLSKARNARRKKRPNINGQPPQFPKIKPRLNFPIKLFQWELSQIHSFAKKKIYVVEIQIMWSAIQSEKWVKNGKHIWKINQYANECSIFRKKIHQKWKNQ